MSTHKRKSPPKMLYTWLGTNRHGKLTSDQWLNLVTAPLPVLLVLATPVLLALFFTPARLFLRFGPLASYALPALLVGMVVMLLFRARHYATLPLYQGVFYPGERGNTFWARLRRQITVYTPQGDPVLLDGFAADPPYLEPDTPYLMYYLEEPERRTLLSYAPTEHPDIDRWQPSERFHERQQRRMRSG